MYGWLQNKHISLASPLGWPGQSFKTGSHLLVFSWDELHFTHTFSNNALINYHITYSAEEFFIKYAWVLFSPRFRADIALISRVWLFLTNSSILSILSKSTEGTSTSKHENHLTVKESCLSSWDIYCHQSLNWFRASWSANDCQRYKTSNQDKLSWRPPWRIWKWVDGKALALFLKLFLVFSRQNMRIYAQKSYCMIRTAIALAHFSQGPDSLMLES